VFQLYPTDKLTRNESASYLGGTRNFQKPIILSLIFHSYPHFSQDSIRMKYKLEFSKQLNDYKTFTGNLHVHISLEMMSKISVTCSVPIIRKLRSL